jgi:hypothetical protein
MTGMLLSGRGANLARVSVAVLIILFAVLVAAGVFDVISGAVAAGILLAAGLFFTVDLRSIKTISAGKDGFSLETHLVDAQAAAAGAPPEEEEATAGDMAQPGGKLTELRWRLEAKISYMAGHMDLDSGAVMIGSLRHDGYLTDEEARTADLLLHTSEAEFARATLKDREEFLEAAESLVDSIRASVLAGAVQKELKRNGWRVEPADSGKRDLLARRDGQTGLVVPVFSVSTKGELPAKVAQRVEQIDGVDRRVIVLPNNSKAPTTPGSNPAIVRLADVESALAAQLTGEGAR